MHQGDADTGSGPSERNRERTRLFHFIRGVLSTLHTRSFVAKLKGIGLFPIRIYSRSSRFPRRHFHFAS